MSAFFFKDKQSLKSELKNKFLLQKEPKKAQSSLKNFNLNDNDSSGLPDFCFSDPVFASAFLDGISLFELEGAKWMLGLPPQHWDAEMHEHCFDEVRHTKLVQDQAKKLRWEFSAEQAVLEIKVNRLFQKSIKRYLSCLSKKIFKMTFSQGVGNLSFSQSSYALLSFAIERRIMKIYPRFAKLGPTESVRQMAVKIIKDERKHLGFVGEKMENSLSETVTSQQEIIQIEERLFKIAMDELKVELAKEMKDETYAL